MRGIKKSSARTTTSAMRGVFLDNDNSARAEFLGLIK
jgi:GTP cyclohydrolase I